MYDPPIDIANEEAGRDEMKPDRFECDECDWTGDDPIEVEPRTYECPECGSDMLFDHGEES